MLQKGLILTLTLNVSVASSFDNRRHLVNEKPACWLFIPQWQKCFFSTRGRAVAPQEDRDTETTTEPSDVAERRDGETQTDGRTEAESIKV